MESILQICNVTYRNGGEYLCSASSGYTSVIAPSTNITVFPGKSKLYHTSRGARETAPDLYFPSSRSSYIPAYML